MQRTALFLPGLDGEPFTAGKVSEHLHDVRLVVFAYPGGRVLDRDSLCGLIGSRLEREGARLLIGESFGGAVAQEFALRNPGDLNGLMLLSTFSREVESFAATLGRLAARWLPRGLLSAAARALADWKLAGTLRGEERRRFLDRFAALDMADLASRLELLRGFDSRARLAQLDLPVDVVYGSRDPLAASPDQLQAWKALPDCRVHPIKGFGHMVSAEASPQVAALIEKWARRACGASGDNRGD